MARDELNLVIRKHESAAQSHTSLFSKKEQHVLLVWFCPMCVFCLCVFINTIQQIIILIIIQQKKKKEKIHKTLYYFSLPEWTKYNKLKLSEQKVHKKSIKIAIYIHIVYIVFVCLLSAFLVHAQVVTGSSGRGFYEGAEGPLKQPFTPIPRAYTHHAVNTGNKGAKVSKDILCFGGVGGGALPVAELKVFFSNRLLRILHCLDTVPPLDQVLGIALPCAVVMWGVCYCRRCCYAESGARRATGEGWGQT